MAFYVADAVTMVDGAARLGKCRETADHQDRVLTCAAGYAWLVVMAFQPSCIATTTRWPHATRNPALA